MKSTPDGMSYIELGAVLGNSNIGFFAIIEGIFNDIFW